MLEVRIIGLAYDSRNWVRGRLRTVVWLRNCAKIVAGNEQHTKKCHFRCCSIHRGLKNSIPNFLNKTNIRKDSKFNQVAVIVDNFEIFLLANLEVNVSTLRAGTHRSIGPDNARCLQTYGERKPRVRSLTLSDRRFSAFYRP